MSQILYLGLDLPSHLQTKEVVHYPFIKIVPKTAKDPAIVLAFEKFKIYTHLIFTSKRTVSIFFDLCQAFDICHRAMHLKTIIAVGQKTALKLRENSVEVNVIASEETAEGLIKELNTHHLSHSNVFFPHSSIARPLIRDWLTSQGILHTACAIYTTLPNIPTLLPDLRLFDQIIFTSPSTINAFIQAYGALPTGKILTSIGPVTESYLREKRSLSYD